MTEKFWSFNWPHPMFECRPMIWLELSLRQTQFLYAIDHVLFCKRNQIDLPNFAFKFDHKSHSSINFDIPIRMLVDADLGFMRWENPRITTWRSIDEQMEFDALFQSVQLIRLRRPHKDWILSGAWKNDR